MKRALLAIGVGLAAGSLAMLLIPHGDAAAKNPALPERWINDDLLDVEVNGRWERVPLMPVVEHLPQSEEPLFAALPVG